jgi:hypothetical protein
MNKQVSMEHTILAPGEGFTRLGHTAFGSIPEADGAPP